jgi:hypothetical protein
MSTDREPNCSDHDMSFRQIGPPPAVVTVLVASNTLSLERQASAKAVVPSVRR